MDTTKDVTQHEARAQAAGDPVPAGVGLAAAADTGAIRYRPMRWDDLDAMSACFDRVWPTTPDIAGTATGRLVSRYMTLHYLEMSTWSNVATTRDGVFAGVTLARIEGYPFLFPQAHAELESVRARLLADPLGAAKIHAFEDGFFRREEILEEDSDVAEDTQAELELFMVNPDVRGHGVGRELWGQLLRALARYGVRAFFLHTDTSCDYGFYEHKGLDRVAERLHADHPEDDDLAPGMTDDDQFIYRGEVDAA